MADSDKSLNRRWGQVVSWFVLSRMKEHFGWFFSLFRRRPKILLIADVPDWIFARHCRMLERFLGTEYCFTTAYQHQVYREKDYDLIYPLEFNLVEPEQVRTPAKYVTGIRSHLTWVRKDFIEIVKLLRTRFQRVHTVSRRLQRVFAPQVPGVVRVTHGVDTEFFVASTQADQSGSRLRLGWAGNRLNSSKGFEEFVLPLEQLPGVELIFCGYQDRNLDVHQMRAFYDSLDAYVCTSDLEGNNNALMEAAAMQRAIITTDNGTVPEYLRHGESAIIVERAPDRFREAVLQLRDNPQLRVALGRKARPAVAAAFEWEKRAQDYRTFFRSALRNKATWRPS
jgi:glycosyltransferase involved in cell wall biosynthesis